MSATSGFISGNADESRSLVVVFLRGGADGLALVPPLGDDDYQKARPRLRVTEREGVKLDGFFGLHPHLKPLQPLYAEGQLAVVTGAGSEDTSRSHFEAQDLMEHGGTAGGGWLGRFLRYRPATNEGKKPQNSALSAIAVGKELPECLRGAPAASVMQSIDEFSLGAGAARFSSQLQKLYAAEENDLGAAGRDTLDALRRIEQLRKTPYSTASGAVYADDDFAQGLRQIARLIKARVGLEAASIDLGGWDSHFTQSTLIDPLMLRLGAGLAAFTRDMGRWMDSTTVVVMTEFGRRLVENASFGTDHGRASVMFVLGGGVRGGQVLGRWPGLQSGVLDGPGDLPVTTNYRNVLAPILRRHGMGDDMRLVFPRFLVEPINLYT
ncbi:MAG: DUF1501 domain-containing protein [Anaerolineae bacterium]|nr:DUF1501 domain-containing protein [Gemmatimonadaceae bacterium]